LEFGRWCNARCPRAFDAAWFTTKQWADDHPDLLRRFVTAMREASAWANANHDKSGEVFAKYTKMDPAAAAKIRRRN